MVKIVFMGTPEFAVSSLEVLNQREDEVLLVISQKDKPKGRGKKIQMTPVKEKALEYGYRVWQPDKVKDEESVALIKSLSPDLIVVTAYGQILSKEILDIPKYGCVNVHASLLPKYRGAAPINFALINGEEYSGITTIFMEEGLDTGDMIFKDEVKISESDTISVLTKNLADLSKITLKRTLEEIEKGTAPREKQNHEEATYAPIMRKELGNINWASSAREIVNLWRGVDIWPGAYTFYKGEKIKLSELKLGGETTDKIGKILSVGPKSIKVATGEGIVEIYKVQFPNKKLMLVSEFIKGNIVGKGCIFGQ